MSFLFLYATYHNFLPRHIYYGSWHRNETDVLLNDNGVYTNGVYRDGMVVVMGRIISWGGR